METRELLELNILIKICDATLCVEPNKDGRRIVTINDGYRIGVDKIRKRADELLSKFLEPYKIKSKQYKKNELAEYS